MRAFVSVGLAAALWLAAPARAQEAPKPPAPPAPESAPAAPEVPGLADLIPKAAELEQRRAALEAEIAGFPDPQEIAAALGELDSRVGELGARLEALTRAGDFGYEEVAEIKALLEAERAALEEATGPVQGVLSTLDRRKAEWEAERDRWAAWRNTAPKELAKEGAEAFRAASRSADAALQAVARAAKPYLGLQKRAEDARLRIESLLAETDRLLETVRSALWRRSAPTMLSAGYLASLAEAFRPDTLASGVRSIRWPDRRFWARAGWVVALQVALAAAVAGLLRRNRERLSASERWRFLAERAVAAAVLVGVGLPFALYPVLAPTWRLLLWVLIGLSAARLVTVLLPGGWRRRLVYLLAGLFLVNQALRVAGVPAPLFRLYVFAVSAVGVPLCLWRARVARGAGARWYARGLRLGAAVLGAVGLAQAAGYANLAAHLLDASIQTTFLLLLAWVVAVLVQGGVEYVTHSALWGRLPLGPGHGERLSRHLLWGGRIAVALAAWGLVAEVWRLSESPWSAVASLLSLGATVGNTRISLGLVAGAAVVLYGALLTSWLLQGLLESEVYPRRAVDRGTGLSINRLIHYALVLMGFLVALSTLGFELRNLTILAGAFGIGIGFGLQTIVNNFVSGLILLFERPIKVGDVVQIDGEWAIVRKLGLRATVVETFDQSEVIVPNADLVSGRVTNWTLSTRMVRVVVPVGVAYGSDVEKVMEILREVADEHPQVRRDPPPQVLFLAFGESSLDFELRVWVGDVDDRLRVRSELHRAIDRKFREAGVEIPFPQRDLHVRTVDERAAAALAGPRPAAGPAGEG
ncbi:mechanosensitive ion channel domain-containing protein [Deferrisoma palaeochoriense]